LGLGKRKKQKGKGALGKKGGGEGPKLGGGAGGLRGAFFLRFV